MIDSIAAGVRFLLTMWLGILFLFLMWLGWCLWWRRGTDAAPIPEPTPAPPPADAAPAPSGSEQLVEVGEAVLTVQELDKLTKVGLQPEQIQQLALVWSRWQHVADIAH